MRNEWTWRARDLYARCPNDSGMSERLNIIMTGGALGRRGKGSSAMTKRLGKSNSVSLLDSAQVDDFTDRCQPWVVDL